MMDHSDNWRRYVKRGKKRKPKNEASLQHKVKWHHTVRSALPKSSFCSAATGSYLISCCSSIHFTPTHTAAIPLKREEQPAFFYNKYTVSLKTHVSMTVIPELEDIFCPTNDI